MEYQSIIVESYLDIKLELEYCVQNSDTLTIILPGRTYTIYGPSLYYAYTALIELGVDTLSLEYGYQKLNEKFSVDMIQDIINDCRTAIDLALKEKKYSKIIFVGKSMGTYIMSQLMSKYVDEYMVIPVFITPVKGVKSVASSMGGLIIVGTNDPHFTSEDIIDVSANDDVELYIVDGGNHDLEVDSYTESLNVLKESTIQISDYIISKLD